jgi:lipopolysaccharide/colanic/teichoic acid biosynthesis glycosyltransferase
MKRLFDVLISLVCLILFIPVMVVIAILIKRDGGSIFFKQTRIGLGGEHFGIYKFRSMVVNAEQLGGYSTQLGDSRITDIGKFIRKTSIDELPQLINVLLGDMSLVGPRPNVPAQEEEYSTSQWDKRNSVIPGITGLAQATLRSKATWQQRYDLDIEYIRNKSFLYDIKIIFMTIQQVLFKGGN